MLNANQLDAVYDKDVIGSDGSKIGSVGQVYLDDQTGNPEWVTIKTGLFGSKESFAPLSGASLNDAGLSLPYSKDKVKDAPSVGADGHLEPSEEEALYQHYGVDYTSGAAGGFQPSDTTATGRGTVGRDVSGPETDDAMTRSEERLKVGTERVEAGRVRLRKHIVTEQVSTTVPVSHEEARVVREPITDANRGAALSGAELSEEEHEVVLHAERPVVDKETVPVERVRLDVDTVTGQERVTGEVRKEQIETVDETTTRGTDKGRRDRR